ncbi:DUF6538 domain-containing protein [Paucibacter sp. TC2R-5]|uniref:DUF6538 domain-containing protein n=1 Tax=Paucibacter sp. TC2R-5 TaxID=2893555 RepID=UPI0039DFF25A
MDGLFRRGAKWYARLVISHEFRATLGKTEFVASTRCHDQSMAKVVASNLLAGWRRRLADLHGIHTKSMESKRLVGGHPALSGNG